MDSEKLKQLQIRPEAKGRSRISLWIIILLVAIVSAGAGYVAWQKKDERRIVGQQSKAPSDSNTLTAPTNSLKARASSNGSVLTVSGYIINRERIELSPRFLGMVKWIGVKKGDTVTNGQVVVLLDDAEHKARLHEAEGRLANAKSAVEKAQLDYARVQKLIAQNIETKQNEDDARIRVASAEAVAKEAEAAVELARAYLDWTVIKSPINGVVLEKLVDAGELVTPQSFGGTRGPSTAFLAIADPNDLQVEVDLNEADLAKVFLNQKCRVSPEAFPDKAYSGFVAEMAPEANRQKGTLQAKVQIQSPDRFLTPELSARVDFLGKTD